MTEMNREAIQQVIDLIRNSPPGINFDMSHFAGLHDCGTAACIAGYAIAMKVKSYSSDDIYAVIGADFIQPAAEILGLTYEQGDALFLPGCFDGWEKITPAHAIAVLNDLLATGEVNWIKHMDRSPDLRLTSHYD